MRYPLSTHTDGSFLTIDTSLATLVHREDTESGTRYIKVVGFNRGKRARNLSFTFNDTEAVYATVQPGGNPQILVPDIPIFNQGSGIDIYASIRQSVFAWSIPDALIDLVVLDEGKAIGLVSSNITADASAQPMLLHVTDSRRSDTDIDPSKGSDAIIEIYQKNTSIFVEILEAGYNLVHGNITVSLKSGVYIYGNTFSN